MTNLAVCIACLGTNVKMFPIINPIHKELFVKLADFKPAAGDATLDMLCYICFPQLQRCYRFISMSRKAQGILQQLRQHGSKLSQCTVSAMKEKPTNSFVISDIKSYYDKVFTEDTMESISSAQDIKPMIVVPMHKVKEEFLDITDVAVEHPISVKEEFADNFTECTLEKQQPHDTESKVDLKGTHLITQLKSTKQAYIDNSKMSNGIHPLTVPEKTSSIKKENSLLIPQKRKYVSKQRIKKVHVCNDCGKNFKCRNYLERHLRVHTGEKPFTCDNCNRKFSQQSHLIQHMRRHTGEKPYTCYICKNKSFNHQSNYKTHMKKHFGEKTQKCTLCEAKFHRKSDLQRHSLTHTGEKPFSCKICQTKFSQKCHMSKHIQVFHSGDKIDECSSSKLVAKNNDNSQETLKDKKVTKQFTCTYSECLKIFKRKGALYNHINRIHLGIEPDKSFFCMKCQTKFTEKIKFKKHLCELKFKDSEKNAVQFEHQDLQKNQQKIDDNLQQDLININEDNKLFHPQNDGEEYIIP